MTDTPTPEPAPDLDPGPDAPSVWQTSPRLPSSPGQKPWR
jgi:hypothetical protein